MKLTDGDISSKSLSILFGFSVPEAFANIIKVLYEQAEQQARAIPDLFTKITGLELAGADARYPQTPAELFPVARLGVDGVHYGYVIHAPELFSQDYPLGEFSPMDDDGVALVGSDTYSSLGYLLSAQLEDDIGDLERIAITEFSRAIKLQPSPNKIHQRWDSQGNSLPIRPKIPPGWSYRPSADGVGVLAPQEMFRPRDLTVDQVNMIHTQQLNEADQAYEEGFFATALYVLREAYWYNWTDSKIAPEISSRLIQVYNALGRGKLAVVVEHRSKI